MPCYHPLTGAWTGDMDPETGKRKFQIWSGDYLNEIKSESFKKFTGEEFITVPCGHCIGCRLDYSRQWADRMMLELQTNDGKGVFLTLTYNDESLVRCGNVTELNDDYSIRFSTLNKVDCQLFMKRLRQVFSDKKIRFYLAGEYGSSTKRPHYHCILFGLDLDDIKVKYDDLSFYRRSDAGNFNTYISNKFSEKLWKNGFCVFATVSWKTCAYVSRYVTKKLNGDRAIEYAERNCIPEFCLMSRRPGIGFDFYCKYKDSDLFDSEKIIIKDAYDVRKIGLPKYFLDKLEDDDPERYKEIRDQRRRFSSDKELIELQSTELDYLEYLESKEMKKKQFVVALKRK